MSDLIQQARDGGALVVTLNRPDKRNALNSALLDGLHAALDTVDLDPDIRVLVLRGAGKDFCAGADLEELLASADHLPAENERDALRLGTVLQRLRSCPRPVVAVVQGRALAGGAGLALACDIVLASATSQFGYPEIQRGFVPAIVMTFLRRLTGEKLAFDLVATGRLLTASEALAAGLVTRVLPDAELDTGSRLLIEQLAAASPSAMHLTKKLFYELDDLSVDDGIALGARINALARTTADFRAAIARFLTR